MNLPAFRGNRWGSPRKKAQRGRFVRNWGWRRGLRVVSGQGGRGFESGDLPAQPAMEDETQGDELDLAGHHLLGDKTPAAGGGRFRVRIQVVVAGYKDNRSLAVASGLVDSGTGGKSVHARHAHIEEDQVE